MRWVSLLGLLSILGLAWLMSYKRTSVKLRPIVWGLSIQFLFALIIFRKDNLSFLGMILFSLLCINFVCRNTDGTPRPYPALAITTVGGLAIGIVSYFAGTVLSLGWIWLIGVVALVLAGKFGGPAKVLRWGKISLIMVGLAYLVRNQLYGSLLFDMLSTRVTYFLGLADFGSQFLFGNLADNQYFFTQDNPYFVGYGFQFAFKVLPTIIFFGGFMSVMYYLGIMQKIIETMSRFMRWTTGTSGAESLSCSANIFVGQTEAPLLIKPFLDKMTSSELLTIMVGGFATIAGGVLAGYVNMGVDAGHLIAASVMSAPAALVIGKIIYPETEKPATAGDVPLPKIQAGSNVLEAASTGITDGLKLALNVGAMLIGFIALIAFADVLLNWVDSWIDGRLLGGDAYDYAITGSSPVVKEYAGIFPGSLQTFFGNVLRPLAWLMGVPWEDADKVGNLLGVKLSLNEFVAFSSLGTYINDGVMGERAGVIATYALCGFANFSSIGIQLGGIAALAPERKSDLSKVALRAMFGGALASWSTATLAGILL